MVSIRYAVLGRYGVISEIRTSRKVPWRLSATRKANVRDRLKRVDGVIDAVRDSGVQCAALASPIPILCAVSKNLIFV